MEVPNFHEVGAELKRQYYNAVTVRSANRGRELQPRRKRNKMSNLNLVNLERSPNYCNADPEIGILGTQGRECKNTGRGADSCKELCCNRGFRAFKVRISEQCHCKFQWCCSVKCDICTRTIVKYRCNWEDSLLLCVIKEKRRSLPISTRA